MKYIYYIIFFVGITVLAIAGVVWYLRKDNANLPSFNPFQSPSQQEELYDPPSTFIPGDGYNPTTEIEPTPTELVPVSLPSTLQQSSS